MPLKHALVRAFATRIKLGRAPNHSVAQLEGVDPSGLTRGGQVYSQWYLTIEPSANSSRRNSSVGKWLVGDASVCCSQESQFIKMVDGSVVHDCLVRCSQRSSTAWGSRWQCTHAA